MKAIWRGEDDILALRYGKEYEVLDVVWDDKWFSVVDETGDDFLYPAEDFEITSGSIDEFKKEQRESL